MVRWKCENCGLKMEYRDAICPRCKLPAYKYVVIDEEWIKEITSEEQTGGTD